MTPREFDLPLARLPSTPTNSRRWRALRLLYVRAVESHRTSWITETWTDPRRREKEVRRLMQDEAGLAQWEKFVAERIVPVDIPDDLENASLEEGVERHKQRWAEHQKFIMEILPAAYAALRDAGLSHEQAFEKLLPAK